MKHHYIYKAYWRHTVDLDTHDLLVDLGFGVFNEIRVELQGVKLKPGANPKKARARAAVTLDGTPLLIQTVKMKTKDKEQKEFDKYLADIFIDGVSLADFLISEGYAIRDVEN